MNMVNGITRVNASTFKAIIPYRKGNECSCAEVIAKSEQELRIQVKRQCTDLTKNNYIIDGNIIIIEQTLSIGFFDADVWKGWNAI
jgi:hypothetical protein